MALASLMAGLLVAGVAVYRLQRFSAARKPTGTSDRIRVAQDSLSHGDYSRAEDLYRKVLRTEPHNADALAGLVKVLDLETKEKKDQIPQLLMQEAKSRQDLKDYAGAADLYREVLKADPSNADARRNLNAVVALTTPPGPVASTPAPRTGSPNATSQPVPPRTRFRPYFFTGAGLELTSGTAIDAGHLAGDTIEFSVRASPRLAPKESVLLRWTRTNSDGTTVQVADRRIAGNALDILQPLGKPQPGKNDIAFLWRGTEVAHFTLTVRAQSKFRLRMSDAPRTDPPAPPPPSQPVVGQNQELASLNREIAASEARLQVLLRSYQESYPDVKSLRSRLAVMRKRRDDILALREKVPEAPPPKANPIPQRLGGNVAAANLIRTVTPVYPPLAKAARVQGTVKLEAVIAKDGSIQSLKLIGGPPLLVQAALQAVQQWQYKPTLLNGEPVEVITTIDVNFTLSN